ncbi:cell envelope biogenesis protein OmpA [Ruegeria marisrubri]|uniref:Cell envelope biogenesis protein OmpA n=1 Tax=Ruegeria marisrubri TaxID=1685379 RepID=A0A0X3TND2_9RHOB|nr:OmpA family protein [Ruegeria marisrubri]KUJ76521.1 cell envelope biogenesis protein OmpA [Ruegeria marisrubri]
MKRALALCAALAAAPLAAQELKLPGGVRQLTERITALDSYDLPVGVYADGSVPSKRLEGQVERRTWRFQAGSRTTLQILAPLREQLQQMGYDILLDCEARSCGGFDFRYGTEVVPNPDMYVAIHDYRFLSATRGDEAISVLISRNPPDGYIQIIRVLPDGTQPEAPLVVAGSEVADEALLAKLKRDGHVILDDLTFGSGAADLGEGPFASLAVLAEFLKENPRARLALVGHTDDVGTLEGNIALSLRRAQAVRNRLIEVHGIDGERLEAEGVGYLAPLTSNHTPEGRELNRRVEAVMLGG